MKKKKFVLTFLLATAIFSFAAITVHAQSKRQALITKIATMVSSGESGTVTLEDGTQIFVSITGTLITSSSTSITSLPLFFAIHFK